MKMKYQLRILPQKKICKTPKMMTTQRYMTVYFLMHFTHICYLLPQNIYQTPAVLYHPLSHFHLLFIHHNYPC